MARFDYHCENGHIVEITAKSFAEAESRICPWCAGQLIGLASAPSVQPDPFWHGVYSPNVKARDGSNCFTSRSAYRAAQKEQGQFTNEPGVEKDIENNYNHRLEQNKKKRDAKIEKLMHDITI